MRQCDFKRRVFTEVSLESKTKCANEQEIGYIQKYHIFLALYVNPEKEK